MPEYKDIVAILATLVASFAGAWAAFLFESQRRNREADERNAGSANRAIYTLFNLWNILEQYRKEVLEPYRGKADAWLNLAANPAALGGDHTFQAGDLQFLLQTKQASVYAALMLEEQRFGLAIALIRSRSTLVLEEVFSIMSKAGVPVGKALPAAEVESILGIDLTHKLKQITGAIYTNVDENLASLKSQHDALRDAMKALYPKRKFLQIEFSLPTQ